MTGYGLLALTLSERLGEAFQAAQWLLERPVKRGEHLGACGFGLDLEKGQVRECLHMLCLVCFF